MLHMYVAAGHLIDLIIVSGASDHVDMMNNLSGMIARGFVLMVENSNNRPNPKVGSMVATLQLIVADLR